MDRQALARRQGEVGAAVSSPPAPVITADGGKPRPSLLPFRALDHVIAVREYAHEEYGEGADLWRDLPDGKARYWDATLRHVFAIAKGEELDKKSGLPHLAHAACNLLFLLELHYP